jgi:hypothetical protein
MAWSSYANPDLVTADTQHGHCDIITHHQFFIYPPGQNQHRIYSMCRGSSCWNGRRKYAQRDVACQCLAAPVSYPEATETHWVDPVIANNPGAEAATSPRFTPGTALLQSGFRTPLVVKPAFRPGFIQLVAKYKLPL